MALVGAIALLPLGNAAPAEAAVGASSSECDPAQRPSADITPADSAPTDDPSRAAPDSVTVSPATHRLTEVACGVESAVLIPDVEGGAWAQSRTGSIVTTVNMWGAIQFQMSATGQSPYDAYVEAENTLRGL